MAIVENSAVDSGRTDTGISLVASTTVPVNEVLEDSL
jgi:hypothetical protein